MMKRTASSIQMGRTMTITLNLSPEVEQRLRRKAAVNGQPLETYLEKLIGQVAQPETSTSAQPKRSPDKMLADQLIAEFRAWAASHRSLPTIADDSRENIYEGRGE
jgi:hypothetical protein